MSQNKSADSGKNISPMNAYGLTQAHILQELNLFPVWRQRQENNVAPAPSAAPTSALIVDRLEKADPDIAISQEHGGIDARSAEIMRMDWAVLNQTIRNCTACPLHKTRSQGVVGVGVEQADWLIVGEAPGADEDIKGEPFVGQAGKLLDNMLASIGLSRKKNVYIANVLKSRPPGNRNPLPEEVTQCSPYLFRQIELIQPKIIITLGRFAAQTLLGEQQSIAALRGRAHYYKNIPVIVTYHPAYLLRNLPDKAKAWRDLCLAQKTIRTL